MKNLHQIMIMTKLNFDLRESGKTPRGEKNIPRNKIYTDEHNTRHQIITLKVHNTSKNKFHSGGVCREL